MKNVLRIISAISNTKSSNEKIKILKNEAGNKSYELLTSLLSITYNPYLVFNVGSATLKKLRNNKKVGSGNSIDISNFLFFLDRQITKVGCSNEDISDLVDILSGLNTEAANFCLLILKKDLRIGMGAKLLNKAVPEMIPVFEVQLCSPITNIPKGSYLVSPKLDGLRCIAVPRSIGYTLYSRNGKPLVFPEMVDVLNKHCGKTNLIFDGEILGSDWNDSMKISRKYNRNMAGLKYNIMDSIYFDEWFGNTKPVEPAYRRYDRILHIFSSFQSEWVDKIPQIFMENTKDIQGFYDYCLDKEYEGIVFKEMTSVYDKKRTWFKKKPTDTYDLVITDCVEGTGKNEGSLGAFSVDLEGVTVSVGSGLSDSQRKEFWESKKELLGMVIEVESDGVTKDGSLRFPRFKNLRKDKCNI